ncbi:hypothetical protein KJ365_04900 [Glaciecola sp. XM2]|uniref:hypothetical protein n=1 Tax=Glaciecola sp. XM2 TaxID=1914931 RepID=UPI001BDF4541|nr:hypothetical protein [Glaciecola sp. XM2]MBT1450210.1 hypothetical protein [Glaciecola sp. XM2]
MPKTVQQIFSMLILVSISCQVYSQNLSGRIEGALINADTNASYQEKGVGVLRAEQSGFAIQQAFLHGNFRINKDWTFDAVANLYIDGEQNLGLTQASFIYKPLSPDKVKWKAKLGFFYPSLSLENTAQGWLSPYTYTQSAINSWIGEELRVLGAQVSLYSGGRKRNSPWSWEINSGLYKGNDTTGTLLTWRGFATHDRQSLNNDIIQFAPIPSVETFVEGIPTPTYTKPFIEVDGKWGGYVGAHLRYFRKREVRYYYYDNFADPTVVNQERLYAWHTKFHSLSYIHELNRNWRFLAHWLYGSTEMGERGVYADFDSIFGLVSYSQNKHRVSLRLEHFDVQEDDLKPQDPNDSDGQAITIAWRYQITPMVELGMEWHQNDNFVANRILVGEQARLKQTQALAVMALNF